MKRNGMMASQIIGKQQTRAAKKRIEKMALTMAATIPNQVTLDDILLREPDPIRRNTCFEFMKPALRFPNAVCPEDKPKVVLC